MQISNNFIKYNNPYHYYKQPVFCANKQQHLKKTDNFNLGAMPDGIIGKIQVQTQDSETKYINLEKTTENNSNSEIYELKDNNGRNIAFLILNIINIFSSWGHSKRIHIESLMDSCYQNKDAEIRLLQIAQKRSDELNATCDLTLETSVSEIDFYKNLGFKQYNDIQDEDILLTKMYLPKDNSAFLKQINNGLSLYI